MKKYTKVIIGLVLIGVAIAMLTACGSSKPTTSVGSYKTTGFSATVTPAKITVYIVGDGAKALYWTGTWKDAEEKVTSIANASALSGSIAGSQSKTKLFKVSNNTIEFEMTMMGVTNTVKLEKI